MTQRVTAGTSVIQQWLSLRVYTLSSVHTPFVLIVLGQFLLITAHSGEGAEPVLWTLASLGRHPLLFDVI